MDSQFSNLSSSNDDRQILCYRPFFYQLQNEITDDSKEEISKEYNDDFNEFGEYRLLQNIPYKEKEQQAQFVEELPFEQTDPSLSESLENEESDFDSVGQWRSRRTYRSRRREKPTLSQLFINTCLFGIASMLFTFCFPFFGIPAIQQKTAFMNTARKAPGTVIDEKTSGFGKSKSCSSTIAFLYNNEQSIIFKNSECNQEGKHVEVLYNPANPYEADTLGNINTSIMINILLIVLFTLFFLLYLLAFLVDLKKRIFQKTE